MYMTNQQAHDEAILEAFGKRAKGLVRKYNVRELMEDDNLLETLSKACMLLSETVKIVNDVHLHMKVNMFLLAAELIVKHEREKEVK